jgi:hypothetical protein
MNTSQIGCRILTVLLPAAIALLTLSPIGADEPKKADEAKDADDKVTEVKLQDVVFSVPTTWKQEEVTSNLRLAQFRIPAAEGDKEDAELAVFSFGASDVGENIRRWIGQFQPEGRAAKVFTGEAQQGKYVFVDVSGTYNKPVGPPVLRKTEAVPGSRVLAVLLVTPEKGVFYLKMAGLDKTVAAQAAALRASFGAAADKEKDVSEDFQ